MKEMTKGSVLIVILAVFMTVLSGLLHVAELSSAQEYGIAYICIFRYGYGHQKAVRAFEACIIELKIS